MKLPIMGPPTYDHAPLPPYAIVLRAHRLAPYQLLPYDFPPANPFPLVAVHVYHDHDTIFVELIPAPRTVRCAPDPA